MTLEEANKLEVVYQTKIIQIGCIKTNHKLIRLIQDQCVEIEKDPSMVGWVKRLHISDNHKKIANLRDEIKELSKKVKP